MPDDSDRDPLLTVAQVATRLQVSIQTVRRLARTEALRSVYVGGMRRFRPAEIDRFAAGRSIKTPLNIWATAQALHNQAIEALASHAGAQTTTHALVLISTRGCTKAAVMGKTAEGEWTIEHLYTADHYVPGSEGVVVAGVW